MTWLRLWTASAEVEGALGKGAVLTCRSFGQRSFIRLRHTSVIGKAVAFTGRTALVSPDKVRMIATSEVEYFNAVRSAAHRVAN